MTGWVGARAAALAALALAEAAPPARSRPSWPSSCSPRRPPRRRSWHLPAAMHDTRRATRRLPARMSLQTSALILSWIAILLLALTVSGLVRQVHALGGPARPGSACGRARGRPAGRAGAAAPAPRPALPRPGCSTCDQGCSTKPSKRSNENASCFESSTPGRGPASAAHPSITVLGEQADLFDQYDAIATPFAVVIDETGLVRRSKPSAPGWPCATCLTRSTTHPAAPPDRPSTQVTGGRQAMITLDAVPALAPGGNGPGNRGTAYRRRPPGEPQESHHVLGADAPDAAPGRHRRWE